MICPRWSISISTDRVKRSSPGFKLQIPFDTIEFYIGSSYTNKVKYGAVASQSMIYRLRQPSFRIRKIGEIDLLYDGQLIVYSDGFEALDYVI